MLVEGQATVVAFNIVRQTDAIFAATESFHDFTRCVGSEAGRLELGRFEGERVVKKSVVSGGSAAGQNRCRMSSEESTDDRSKQSVRQTNKSLQLMDVEPVAAWLGERIFLATKSFPSP